MFDCAFLILILAVGMVMYIIAMYHDGQDEKVIQ